MHIYNGLEPSEIDELHNGTWQLDCPQMELRKNAINDQHAYVGPGYIRYRPERQFDFKLYSDETPRLRTESFSRHSNAGKIIPDEELYQLVATDLKGRKWKSKNIFPDTREEGQNTGVILGSLHEIQHTSNSSLYANRDVLQMKFFQTLEIPYNTMSESSSSIPGWEQTQSKTMNVAQFQSCGYAFVITYDNNVVTLEAQSQTNKLVSNLDKRSVEALQFVLAHPLDWSIFQKCEKGVITIRIKTSQIDKVKYRMGLPIRFAYADPKGRVWKLYDKYLAHIVSDTKKDRWHSLSSEVNKVIQASAASHEAQALTVSVAVEGVLRTEFSNFAAPQKEEINRLDSARDIIEKSTIDDSLKKRIRSSMSSWHRASATDKLWKLVQTGAIEEKECKTWKKLRPSAVHSDQSSMSDFQTLLDLIDTVTVLFYKLIFQAIGYEGKYTDYSTRGCPLKDYPNTNNGK